MVRYSSIRQRRRVESNEMDFDYLYPLYHNFTFRKPFRMIPWQKLELLEECLDDLDYDSGWNLIPQRNKGRRKMILKALMLPEPVTYKELAEIWNVSTSCIRQVEFRAVRALKNILKKRGLTFNDFVESV